MSAPAERNRHGLGKGYLMFSKPIIGAMLAAMSVSPVLAAEAAFPAVEPVALRVSTKGLDLSDPRDIRALQVRIDKAISAACRPHGSYFATLAPERDCRASLSVDTNRIVATLTKKADRIRMVEF
jgi:UrcA family protein